ncbi:DNA mismatch repair protein Vsr [Pontibacillus chungwhensis BH030062]|uniref:Very short patch repair endonuclease n=1 Tax=Pontibacillus chungwhensis BH030062 TaxID=1385513 RepID=A0A0A2VC67_9BACI|nr:very short patch repair endonuclease [Pontibacillus chungwhensis]KGP91260.1 DNA mismatch repair protein Vsr [Pontibacillus chungwhensis BH030062]
MSDVHSPQVRRKNMKAIKGKDTSIETNVTKELWKRGYRFRKNVKDLYGSPDIAIKRYKIVIFLDSCFWHGCEIHGNMPKNNQEFWFHKLQRNKERDEEVNSYYFNKGWHVLRIWEHDIKSNLLSTVDSIVDFIEDAKEREQIKKFIR